MSVKRLVCTIALVPALAFAACGGDDDSGDDFLAQVDAVCTDSAERATAALAEGAPTNAEEAAAVDANFVDSRQQEIDALEALEPPEDVAAGYEDFVAARSEILVGEESRQAANEQGDQQAVEDAGAYINEAFVAADDAAAAIGLEACVGILPAEEEDAVRAVAEQFFTAETAEALEVACQQATDAYIESIGGLEVCHEPGEPRTIEISDVSGVSGVSAEAYFVPTGGPDDGTELAAYFVYQDGEWLVDALSQAPPPAKAEAPAGGDESVKQAYDQASAEANDAFKTFEGDLYLGLVERRDVEAFTEAASTLRDVVFDFDAELRELPFPDSLEEDVNALLEANGTVIEDLDAFRDARSLVDASARIDAFHQDFDNLYEPASAALAEGL